MIQQFISDIQIHLSTVYSLHKSTHQNKARVPIQFLFGTEMLRLRELKRATTIQWRKGNQYKGEFLFNEFM